MSWYYYARMARRAPTEAAPPPPHPHGGDPRSGVPAPRLSSWSQGSEDARCVEGGWDAGAVFISDICNCEWRGQRTWPVRSRGPAAGRGCAPAGGESGAWEEGPGMQGWGLRQGCGVPVRERGEDLAVGAGCGVCGTAEGVPAKAPLPSMMSSRAIALFLVTEHLTQHFPK